MKKLTRKNLKEVKGGSGGIGAFCGTPRTLGGNRVCLNRGYPVYVPETDCCVERPS